MGLPVGPPGRLLPSSATAGPPAVGGPREDGPSACLEAARSTMPLCREAGSGPLRVRRGPSFGPVPTQKPGRDETTSATMSDPAVRGRPLKGTLSLQRALTGFSMTWSPVSSTSTRPSSCPGTALAIGRRRARARRRRSPVRVAAGFQGLALFLGATSARARDDHRRDGSSSCFVSAAGEGSCLPSWPPRLLTRDWSAY